MFIKIDTREQDLISACAFVLSTTQHFKDLVLVKETLPLGDIIVCDQTIEKVIIERKTLRDLSASIKDGRYEEQSYRLNGIPHPNHNIIYLIEGSMEKINMFKGHNDKMMLYSAMVSINYFKGFSIMRSNSVEESALMICNCAYKIFKSEKEHKKSYYKHPTAIASIPVVPIPVESFLPSFEIKVENNKTINHSDANANIDNAQNVAQNVTDHAQEDDIDDKPEGNEKDYCSVVKKIKKENITPDNIGEIMLCQIPSISSVTALAILAEFKTLPNLIENIKKDPVCLKNISYVSSSGQTRKISKACIENVIKFLAK